MNTSAFSVFTEKPIIFTDLMELTITDYAFGMRPGVAMPDKQILELLGEERVRKLVSDHYDLLVESEIKNLFPGNPVALDAAKERAADFFIQILGGPQYYNENRGNPMMTRRHMPFKITPSARNIWLGFYKELLLGLDLPEHLIQSYWNYLNVFSTWMVNTKE